jgi:hypothetical protein
MSELKNKSIKIENKTFEVFDHFFNLQKNEEILILKRKIDVEKDFPLNDASSKKMQRPSKPQTIKDLGYDEFDDIAVPEEDSQRIRDFIVENENFEVANLDFYGNLVTQKVKLLSRSVKNPDIFKVNISTIKDPSSFETIHISEDFLIKLRYLYEKYMDALVKYKKMTKDFKQKPSSKFDEVLEQLKKEKKIKTNTNAKFDEDIWPSPSSQEMQMISEIFNEMINTFLTSNHKGFK